MRFVRFGIATLTASLLIWLTSGIVLAQPPPPILVFSVNHSGTFDPHTGVATISGTYTCTSTSLGTTFGVLLSLRQDTGRFTSSGFGGDTADNTCDGAIHSWSADVSPQTGRFAGGQSTASFTAQACEVVEGNCDRRFPVETVQLRGGPPP